MIIIGIDPDVKSSGISFYEEGNVNLMSCTLVDLLLQLQSILTLYDCREIQIHIEDIAGTSHNFTASKAKSLPGKLKIARDVGRCEQVQIEIERIAEHFGIPVFRHSLSSKWKIGKSEVAQFKQLTGWTGKSNEDTRSAAYFGYLGVIRNKSGQTT